METINANGEFRSDKDDKEIKINIWSEGCDNYMSKSFKINSIQDDIDIMQQFKEFITNLKDNG